MITGEHVRAARAILRIEQIDLARRAGISVETLKRFEATEGALKGRTENVESVRSALENLGVLFLDDDGENGVGVRLDKRHTEKSKELREEIKKISDEELEMHIKEIEEEMRRRGLNVEVDSIYRADDSGNVTVTKPKRAKGK